MSGINESSLRDVVQILQAATRKKITISGLQIADKVNNLLTKISDQVAKTRTQAELNVYKVALDKLERLLVKTPTLQPNFQAQITACKRLMSARLTPAVHEHVRHKLKRGKEAMLTSRTTAQVHLGAQRQPMAELPQRLRNEIEGSIKNIVFIEQELLKLSQIDLQALDISEYENKRAALKEKIRFAKTFDSYATFALEHHLLPITLFKQLQNTSFAEFTVEKAKDLLKGCNAKEGQGVLFWSDINGWVLVTKDKKRPDGFTIRQLALVDLQAVNFSKLFHPALVGEIQAIQQKIQAISTYEENFCNLTPLEMKNTSLVQYQADKQALERAVATFKKKYPAFEVPDALQSLLPKNSLAQFQTMIFDTIHTQEEADRLIERVGLGEQRVLFLDHATNKWRYVYAETASDDAEFGREPDNIAFLASNVVGLITPSYVKVFDPVEAILKDERAATSADKENLVLFLKEEGQNIKEYENAFLDHARDENEVYQYESVRAKFDKALRILKELDPTYTLNELPQLWPVERLQKLCPFVHTLNNYLQELDDRARNGVISFRPSFRVAKHAAEKIREKLFALTPEELNIVLSPLKVMYPKDNVEALIFSLQYQTDVGHLEQVVAKIVIPKAIPETIRSEDLLLALGIKSGDPAKVKLQEFINWTKNGQLKAGLSASEAANVRKFYQAVATPLFFNIQKIKEKERAGQDATARAEVTKLKKEIVSCFLHAEELCLVNPKAAMEHFLKHVKSEIDGLATSIVNVRFSMDELALLSCNSIFDAKRHIEEFVMLVKTRQARMGTPDEGSVALQEFYETIENSFVQALRKITQLEKGTAVEREKAKKVKKEMLHEVLRAASMCGPRHLNTAVNQYKKIVLGQENPSLQEQILELASGWRDVNIQQLASGRAQEAQERVNKIPQERMQAQLFNDQEFQDVHLANGSTFIHYVNALIMNLGKELGIAEYEMVDDRCATKLTANQVLNEKDRFFAAYNSHAIVGNLHQEFRGADFREKCMVWWRENMPYKWGEEEFGIIKEKVKGIYARADLSLEAKYAEAVKYLMGAEVTALVGESYGFYIDSRGSPHTLEALVAIIEDARQYKFLMQEVVEILPKGQTIQKQAIAKMLIQMGVLQSLEGDYQRSELARISKLTPPSSEKEKQAFISTIQKTIASLIVKPEELLVRFQRNPHPEDKEQEIEKYKKMRALANDWIAMAQTKIPQFTSQTTWLTDAELASIEIAAKVPFDLQEKFLQKGYDANQFSINDYKAAYDRVVAMKENPKLKTVAEKLLAELIPVKTVQEILLFAGRGEAHLSSLQRREPEGNWIFYYSQKLGYLIKIKKILTKKGVELQAKKITSQNVQAILKEQQGHIATCKALCYKNISVNEAQAILRDVGAKATKWILLYDEPTNVWQQIKVENAGPPLQTTVVAIDSPNKVFELLNNVENCIPFEDVPLLKAYQDAKPIHLVTAEERARLSPAECEARKTKVSRYMEEQMKFCERQEKKLLYSQITGKRLDQSTFSNYQDNKQKLMQIIKIFESLGGVPSVQIQTVAREKPIIQIGRLSCGSGIHAQFLQDFAKHAKEGQWILYYSAQIGGLVRTKKVAGELRDENLTLENSAAILADRRNALLPIEAFHLKVLASGHDTFLYTVKKHREVYNNYKNTLKGLEQDPELRIRAENIERDVVFNEQIKMILESET